MQLLEKKWPNNRWAPPTWEILTFDRKLTSALTIFDEDVVSSSEIPWRDILQDLHEPR